MIHMQVWYQERGLLPLNKTESHAPKWTNKRVNKLCQMRNCTPYELGMYFCVSPKDMKRHMDQNRWPSVVALHFQNYENYLIYAKTGVVPAVPVSMPDTVIKDARG